jgi:hypothetical protein
MGLLDEAIKKAQKELEENGYESIQEKTAITWAGRAAWEAKLVLSAKNATEKIAYWTLALEYYTEAIEHAASGGSGFSDSLEKELDPCMDQAFDDLMSYVGDLEKGK